jgi:diguanylate cyclase (GGDEF)-like protein
LNSNVPAFTSISPEAAIALCKFTLAITEANSEKEIFTKLAESLPKILPADRGSVTLLTDSGDNLQIFSLQGSEGMLSIGKYLPIDNSMAGSAVKQLKTLRYHVDENSIEVDAQQLFQQGLLSIMNCPLVFSDRVIGTVNVGNFNKNTYNESSEELLILIATLVSNYLERQHLLEQAKIGIKQYKVYSKQLEALNHVAEKLAGAMNEKNVFNIITQSASQIISAQRISYFVPNIVKNCFEIKAVQEENDLSTPNIIPMENTSLELTLQTGQPQFFTNLAETGFVDHVLLSEKGFQSGWSVPVRVKGEIVGLLNAASNEVVSIRDQQFGVLKMLSGIMGVTLARVKLQTQLEFQACYDSLTGLPNRLEFNKMMDLTIARRTPEPFTLLYIDLDRFKVINDTLGHDIGDELLCLVTQRIHQQIRDEDFVSRHGGDEFVVLLFDCQLKDIAISTSNRILAALKEPFRINQHDIFIGASIGISYYPEHSENSEELLKYADIAMYHAKKQGRNNYELYSNLLSEKIHSTQRIEAFLRLAIKNNEFHLVFQPLISENKVLGVEALLRWQHPELGHMSPEEFIPIAEESLLIEDITEWVIHESLTMVEQFRKTYPDFYVAVNISAKSCLNPDKLKHCILKALNDYNLPGSSIELEITENVFLQNIENTNRLFNELGSYGIRFAIDDFGTGFSSLTYLLSLPLDTLKIDRTFIQDIHCSESKLGVVEGILMIADSLSMNCLAEGIETEEQKECLEKLGCTKFQGYYFSKPLLESDLLLFLLAGNEN